MHWLRTTALVSGAWFSTLAIACGSVIGAELSAGVARIDLTPPLEMNAPLGGYGERMNRPAEGVHDRIFAKALVVSDGKRKFALVTADLLGFSPAIKPAIVERLAAEGWSAEQLLLLASHSHASIEMNAINPLNTFQIPQIGIHNPELYELTINNLVSVIRSAAQSLTPVKVGVSSQEIPGWNRNRRTRDGTTDDELTIVRIDTVTGKPLAVLVNFTAHPTFLGAETMVFSAGWPGYLQRTLETVIGEGATAMFYNGAEGDQSPVSRPLAGASHWERAERFGVELALEAERLWKSTELGSDVVFDFGVERIELPPRTWHPGFKETGGAEYGLTEAVLKEMLPKMFPAESASVSLRLGDWMVVGIPGEMTAELGLQIKTAAKQAAQVQHVTIGGLADVWLSYILTAEEYRRGGYEASVSFYGESLGEVVVEAVIDGASRLNK